MAALALEGLSFAYPGAGGEALSNLSLAVPDGSAHALLGASGAGKTTLLNLLCGLLQPTHGRILLNGREVTRLDPASRNLAMVFQFPVLYEAASVARNLTLPLCNRGWTRAAANARAAQVAEELGITPLMQEPARRLSLFQKQLVSIGKALAPPDLDMALLDEPLTAVEPGLKWRLRQALARLQQAQGLTVIYVTHDQKEAMTFADEVSVMAEGRILQTAPPEEIYERPRHRRVAEFIGMPGMQCLPVQVKQGRPLGYGYQGPRLAAKDGGYLMGVRAEWLCLLPGGGWQVQQSQLRGTAGGQALRLVTLTREGQRLQVAAEGDWPPGTKAGLQVQRCLLFQGDEAVA